MNVIKQIWNLQSTVTAILGLFFISSANALVITPTSDEAILESALLGGTAGLTIDSFVVSSQSVGGALSAGTYTNVSGTYGIGDGVILSTGNVADYGDGPNTSSGNGTSFGVAATVAQEALLDPITGGSADHFDVTQIDIEFTADATVDFVFFDVVFGSEEYAEFVGSSFIDAFGLYLNGVNIAFSDGLPINIDHTEMSFFSGTELDGILADGGSDLILNFGGAVNLGSNTMTFIIADSGDSALDSTVYIQGFGSTPPSPPPSSIPEPTTLALFGFGLVGISLLRKKKTV